MKDQGWLANTSYPGRGLVIGCSADGASSVQLYWIMGRSTSSQQRRFVRQADGSIRVVVTAGAVAGKRPPEVRAAEVSAAPAAAAVDPRLILYTATAVVGAVHVVSNGDQTATIADGLARGDSFATAFASRDVEPDPPHFTPRIAGVVAMPGSGGYELAIVKTAANDPGQVSFQHYVYRHPRPGWGHCLTTYDGDGTPLPPFTGEPFPLPLPDSPAAAVRRLWEQLHRGYRVAAFAKYIARASGAVQIEIINRHGRDDKQ